MTQPQRYLLSNTKYYLFKYEDGNATGFNDPKYDYAISFCRACLCDNNISIKKYWKCDSCNIDMNRSKKFICVRCDRNSKLIERVKNAILKTQIIGNYEFFEKCMYNMLAEIKKLKSNESKEEIRDQQHEEIHQ